MPISARKTEQEDHPAATDTASEARTSFNPVGDLNTQIRNRLSAFDERLMVDPMCREEAIVQSFSRAMGFAAPALALVLLYSALNGSF